jgi:hypothetical protein
MDWDSFAWRLIIISLGIVLAIIVIGFGFLFIMSIAKVENYKCDKEKQAEFILKCITINPNNTDQPAIIEKCKQSAKIFCTPEIITKQ